MEWHERSRQAASERKSLWEKGGENPEAHRNPDCQAAQVGNIEVLIPKCTGSRYRFSFSSLWSSRRIRDRKYVFSRMAA